MTILAYTQAEAAEQLGVSITTFKRHVRPYIKRVELGQRMLFPHTELERWLEKEAR